MLYFCSERSSSRRHINPCFLFSNRLLRHRHCVATMGHNVWVSLLSAMVPPQDKLFHVLAVARCSAYMIKGVSNIALRSALIHRACSAVALGAAPPCMNTLLARIHDDYRRQYYCRNFGKIDVIIRNTKRNVTTVSSDPTEPRCLDTRDIDLFTSCFMDAMFVDHIPVPNGFSGTL